MIFNAVELDCAYLERNNSRADQEKCMENSAKTREVFAPFLNFFITSVFTRAKRIIFSAKIAFNKHFQSICNQFRERIGAELFGRLFLFFKTTSDEKIAEKSKKLALKTFRVTQTVLVEKLKDFLIESNVNLSQVLDTKFVTNARLWCYNIGDQRKTFAKNKLIHFFALIYLHGDMSTRFNLGSMLGLSLDYKESMDLITDYSSEHDSELIELEDALELTMSDGLVKKEMQNSTSYHDALFYFTYFNMQGVFFPYSR